MNNRMQWREAVGQIPVFDTHTHMNNVGVPIAAQYVWDIVHYFWFMQELWSVGYPQDPMALDEEQRISRFVDAFNQVRNTAWALMMRETFRSLYGVELSDARSVREADEAARARGAQDGWPRQVIDRLQIKRITVNHDEVCDFPHLPGVGAAVVLWPGYKQWAQRMLDADDPRAAGEEAAAEVDAYVATAACGCRPTRLTAGRRSRSPRPSRRTARCTRLARAMPTCMPRCFIRSCGRAASTGCLCNCFWASTDCPAQKT